MKDTIKGIRGFVRVFVRNANGSIEQDTGFVENVITNTGLALFAQRAGALAGTAAATYLALGTSATAALASQTALVAEIANANTALGRSGATVTNSTTTQTNDTLQFDYTWTASGSSLPQTIQEIGVFNAASTGVMIARKVITAITINSTQQIIATYKVIFA